MSSLHNALKDATGISNALRRMFGGDSELSVERLSETLQPVVDIWSHPFCDVLRGEDRWAGSIGLSAVAGEFSGAAIINPVGSKLLVVVDHAAVVPNSSTHSLASFPTIAQVTGTFTENSTSLFGTDQRRQTGTTKAVRTQLWSGADVGALGTGYWERTGLTGFCEFVSTPWHLPPGKAIAVWLGTVNIGGHISFSGSERPLLAGELGL